MAWFIGQTPWAAAIFATSLQIPKSWASNSFCTMAPLRTPHTSEGSSAVPNQMNSTTSQGNPAPASAWSCQKPRWIAWEWPPCACWKSYATSTTRPSSSMHRAARFLARHPTRRKTSSRRSTPRRLTGRPRPFHNRWRASTASPTSSQLAR